MSWIQLTYGRPGNCKSLEQAKISLSLLGEYHYIEKKYPKLPKRSLWTNQKLNSQIESTEIPDNHLKYWENPRQLRDLRDVDICWDEIGRHIPADGWKDTPDWLRALFAQHRKRGIRIFANTQDYKAVDINFRRMVGDAFVVRKVMGSRDISATLPPVKFIWGTYMKYHFDPAEIEVEKDPEKLKLLSRPQLRLIRKKWVNAFDTTQSIPRYESPGLEHIEKKCEIDDCGKVVITHRPI